MFFKESARHRCLLTRLNDQLSSVNVHRPVLSDAERVMHQTLEKYQIQLNALGQKMRLLEESRVNRTFNPPEKKSQATLEKIQRCIQYYRDKIHRMKEELEKDSFHSLTV